MQQQIDKRKKFNDKEANGHFCNSAKKKSSEREVIKEA